MPGLYWNPSLHHYWIQGGFLFYSSHNGLNDGTLNEMDRSCNNCRLSRVSASPVS